MNGFVRAAFIFLLTLAGFLCGHFQSAQQLVWVVWLFPAPALAFGFLEMQLAKKKHA
jgi:hypothetical protein